MRAEHHADRLARLRRAMLATLVVTAAALVAAPTAHAADRFVGQGGTDEGDCTSEASPCATVAFAVGVSEDGDTVNVGPGTFTDAQATAIDHDLSITGSGAGESVLRAAFDVGPGAAWYRVEPGNEVSFTNLTIDGQGQAIGYGVRFVDDASGLIDSVAFRSIAGPPGTAGTAVAAEEEAGAGFSGALSISNSSFNDIGRAGLELEAAEGAELLFSSNLYVGKGEGAHSDFAARLSGPVDAFLTGNHVSEALGSAPDLPAPHSAAFLVVSDAFDEGERPVVAIAQSTIVRNAVGVLAMLDSTILPPGDEYQLPEGEETSIVAVAGNRIAANGIGVQTAGVDVDARNNWWGCNEGPAGDGGCDPIGTTAADSVNADPWLVLQGRANPTAIGPGGQTAAVTAEITRNSDGQPVVSAPDGTPVGFETNLGTVDPEQRAMSEGRAMTILTSSDQTGTAEVGASVDAETIVVPVTIAPPPAIRLRLGQRIGLGALVRNGLRVRARCSDATNRVNMRLMVGPRHARRAGLVPRARQNPVVLAGGGRRCGADNAVDERLQPRGRARQALIQRMRPGRLVARVVTRAFGPGGQADQGRRVIVRRR